MIIEIGKESSVRELGKYTFSRNGITRGCAATRVRTVLLRILGLACEEIKNYVKLLLDVPCLDIVRLWTPLPAEWSRPTGDQPWAVKKRLRVAPTLVTQIFRIATSTLRSATAAIVFDGFAPMATGRPQMLPTAPNSRLRALPSAFESLVRSLPRSRRPRLSVSRQRRCLGVNNPILPQHSPGVRKRLSSSIIQASRPLLVGILLGQDTFPPLDSALELLNWNDRQPIGWIQQIPLNRSPI